MKRSFLSLPLVVFLLVSGAFIACNNANDGAVSDEQSEPVADGRDSSFALEPFAEGFTNPLSMEQGPDGHFYIVDQSGQIYISDADGNLQDQPFLDLRSKMVELKNEHDERGLLGLALHPDFAQNGRFYVHYSAPLRSGAPEGWSHTKHVSEFTRNPEREMEADPASERILLRIDQPQSNHNGGTLTFGPDGYLYLSLGDGGGANDRDKGHESDWYEKNAGGNGQYANLFGSILRLDIDAGEPYGIPDDNPFAAEEGRREVFAYGLRNPYRFSFDRGGDRKLYVADVGQKLWEEINIVEPGGNYGWNVKEGFICFNAADASTEMTDCPDQTPDGVPLIDPILVFPHEKQAGYVPYGIAVIGGYVYRGDLFPEMDGSYFFGTWTQQHGSPTGVVYRAQQDGPDWSVFPVEISNSENGDLGRYLNAFAEDREGELYLLTSENEAPMGNTGKIYRIVSNSNYDYAVSENQHEHGGEHDHH